MSMQSPLARILPPFTARRPLLLVLVMAAVSSGVAGAGIGGASTEQAEPQISSARSDCPSGANPLPANAISPAADAALKAASRIYGRGGGIDTEGVKVTGAVRAVTDTGRGPIAEDQCGNRARHRTVVVYLKFPAMVPVSASLSEGVVFVSRFGDKFSIWSQVH